MMLKPNDKLIITTNGVHEVDYKAVVVSIHPETVPPTVIIKRDNEDGTFGRNVEFKLEDPCIEKI